MYRISRRKLVSIEASNEVGIWEEYELKFKTRTDPTVSTIDKKHTIT